MSHAKTDTPACIECVAKAVAACAALVVAISLNACTRAPIMASEVAVRQVWEDYLVSRNGQFAANAGTPSPLWNAEEQAQWPMYDLAGFYVPDQSVPDVVSVTPVNTAVDSAYRIVTQFWPASPALRDSSTKPVLLMTVYARREGDRWVLANALPFRTHTWHRETRGRIRYRVAPALRFDTSRAARAATFVDSLAAAFAVPAPDHIDYYVTETVDQAMDILGVVVPERFGAAGGFAKPVNFQVFSGIPALGENYRHELAHVMLLPVVRGANTSLLASEGVPTWFGGTAGRDYAGSVRHLDAFLRTQPQLDLNKIVFDQGVSAEFRNAAGAVLAQMVNEAGGVDALRVYLRTPLGGMRTELERVLRRPWPAIVDDWRRRVRQIAAT